MISNLHCYHRIAGLRGLMSAIRGKAAQAPVLLETLPPGLAHPVCLRLPSTDAQAFEQVFIQGEYDFDVRRGPRTIIDAGANIGLAAVCFAHRFPDARIVAIEPEEGNFALLERNVAPYRNIVALRCALWHENKTISLVDPNLGQWGFMTQDAEDAAAPFGQSVHAVQARTLDDIMAGLGLDRVDILKMDIEGAEREVFADPSRWIGKVDALIVELHERLKPGCDAAVLEATRGFDQEWRLGENLYRARQGSCLLRPGESVPAA